MPPVGFGEVGMTKLLDGVFISTMKHPKIPPATMPFDLLKVPVGKQERILMHMHTYMRHWQFLLTF